MEEMRAEVNRLLNAKLKSLDVENHYCDIILYDDKAESILGGIKLLNKDTASTLSAAVARMELGEGGTNLEIAMEQRSLSRCHGKPTTIWCYRIER